MFNFKLRLGDIRLLLFRFHTITHICSSLIQLREKGTEQDGFFPLSSMLYIIVYAIMYIHRLYVNNMKAINIITISELFVRKYTLRTLCDA